MELLKQMGKNADENDVRNSERYKEEQQEIKKVATEKQEGSGRHLVQHNALSKGVTLFQIAIAICAISALTRRKWLWYGSIALGIAGVILVYILL
jgi:Flp pilus assembly protein TadB